MFLYTKYAGNKRNFYKLISNGIIEIKDEKVKAKYIVKNNKIAEEYSDYNGVEYYFKEGSCYIEKQDNKVTKYESYRKGTIQGKHGISWNKTEIIDCDGIIIQKYNRGQLVKAIGVYQNTKKVAFRWNKKDIEFKIDSDKYEVIFKGKLKDIINYGSFMDIDGLYSHKLAPNCSFSIKDKTTNTIVGYGQKSGWRKTGKWLKLDGTIEDFDEPIKPPEPLKIKPMPLVLDREEIKEVGKDEEEIVNQLGRKHF